MKKIFVINKDRDSYYFWLNEYTPYNKKFEFIHNFQRVQIDGLLCINEHKKKNIILRF